MVAQSHSRVESFSSYHSDHGNEFVVQRLPLLDDFERDKNNEVTSDYESSSNGDFNRNTWIRITTPTESISYNKRTDDALLFPKEKLKTFLAFGFLLSMFVVNTMSIALTHDRVPDRDTIPPLPDAILDNITPHPELMRLPDVFVIVALVMGLTLLFLHEHRWILGRRIFFILGVLYLMRSVTMYVTVLPVANHTVYCAPKMNSTSVTVVFGRVWELLVGGGLQISGMKKSCGDYIYSGHTVMLVVANLMIREYSPVKYWFLHWTSFAMAWIGMGILLLARGHYTIDVLIGYYAATRMFWAYHTLANNAQLKIKSQTNFHSEVWWFRIFQYLEENVGAPLPKRYSFPLPLLSLSSFTFKNR